MDVWINKKELEWLEEMQNEGRTRDIPITTFPRFNDGREVKMKLVRCDEDEMENKAE